MNIILPLKLAGHSLITHKGRTFLTVLGMVIGIAAVIIVMSAGESLKGLVLGELESFGSDFIQIEVKAPDTAKNSASSAMSLAQGIQVTTLTLDDAKDIGRLSNIKNYYASILGQSVVSYLDQNKTVTFWATSAEFINIDKSELIAGRFYTRQEDEDLAKVAVLGNKLATSLFGNQDPIGASIKIGKNKFKVIGVFKEKGGGLGFDYDQLAYLPIQTAQKMIMGIDYVMMITAQVKDVGIQDQTADEIVQLLRENHDITDPKKDDFAVTTVAEAREIIDTIFGGITLLLIAIAGTSLLVGGVGIMNIMYVSVTERTFEIGLRKSLGAKQSQILWQFLWEAMAVTFVGGIIGIILGVGFSFLISQAAGLLGFSWGFYLPPESVAIAFIFSAAVGLLFGFYPARKAARLDPINALRHEQ